jgi:hypothetical protein
VSKGKETIVVSRQTLTAFAAAFALAGSGLFSDAHAGAGRQQKLAARQPEADPQTVSVDARRSYQEFWAKLPSDKSAALERELDRLEDRAKRGKPVDADLSKLRARYPELSQMAGPLTSVRWITADSPGTSAALVCTGIPFVGRNGRARCIGALARR